MQDRFKFRFFDKDKKIMIKPPDEMSESEWRRCCNIYGYDEWYFSIELTLTKVLDYFDKTSFEIMQCTGLKDQNSKLIYEGDIVKDLIIPEIFYIVKWFNSGFYLESTISGSFLKFNDTQQEVIGNIYKNPELLEEASNDN